MPNTDITLLLSEAYAGREAAFDEVMEQAYTDLRRLADKHLHQHYGPNLAGATLEPSALVNETYMRLIRQRKRYDSRGHFFAIATRVMLRVLMDHHRRRGATKRFGGQVRMSLSGVAATEPVPSSTIPAFADALERLEQLDARTAEVIKLRLIWGLTIAETAECLDVSASTVEREWRFGRSWLAGELVGEG